MKHFRIATKYITSIILGLLALSCSDDPAVLSNKDTSAILDGDKIVLTGSLTIPEAADVSTRYLRTTPELSGLHLYAVEFTNAGNPLTNMFVRIYEAENEEVSGDQVNFSITLRSTTLPRVLHLIALPKDRSLDISDGIEGAVIPALVAQGNVDAYWRRFEFPAGYCVETAGSWVVDPKLVETFTRVPLIRNYAKFTVSNEAAGFTLLGFKLVNTPSQGSIAAWNPSTRKFIDFLDDAGEPLEYSQISEIYSGLFPAGTAINNQILPPAGTVIPNNADEPQFMYERPFNENDRTYLIVKGSRNGSIFYYKLDIGKNDADGVFRYYNILRNFHYKIVIKTVSADGYPTVEGAASGSVFNNISFDIELEKLTNMSDGAEIVYVDYTSNILTADTAQVVNFSYRYKNISTGQFNSSGTRLVDFEPGSVIQSVGTPVYGSDGYVTVNFTCRPAEIETKTQKFIVIKPSTGLGRTVTLISHLKWDIGAIRVYPEAENSYPSSEENRDCLPGTVNDQTIGNPFTLFFDLPEDLPEVVFPLDFTLESKEQIMENQPGKGSMPVESGVSLFNSGTTAIQYKREITWTEYHTLRKAGGIMLTNGKRRVVCNFRTTKPLTNGTQYTFRISNPNFHNMDIVISKTVNLP